LPKPPVGALALAGRRKSRRPGPRTAGDDRVRQCLRAVRPHLRPGSNNKHDETIATTLNQAVGSEDCLYLNVWRPATNESNLPVIVFLHGGSNVSGYTADPMYDGAALAKTANAIVVTPNFRLGILGFMNLPQLKTGDASTDSGNFTMLDSIKALQFVRTNSSSFGGNPDNVTVVGQSAGAINVWALQTSPLMTAANPRAVPPRDALVGRHFAGDQPASRQPAHPEPGIGVPGPGQRAAAKPGDR
jgi:carboxylesterase type B